MAIKIKKNGKIENFTLHSTDVKVLDLEGKFKKKDLESVIREISDTEHIHIGEVDSSKDGIWIDDGEILDNSKNNGVVERVKTFVNETIGELSSLTTSIKSNLVGAINEIKGNVDQLSNPNLLINGDFQVWQRGNNFNITKDGKYNYTADRWIVQTDSDNTKVTPIADGGMRVDMSKFNGTYANIIQFIELPYYEQMIGKTVTVTVKLKSGASNLAIGLRALPDASATHIQMNKAATEFSITAKVPRCAQKATKFMVYVQNREKQILDFEYIKMEMGNVSTPLVRKHYGEELSMCQRYYEVVYHSERLYNNMSATPHGFELKAPFKVRKRIKPTMAISYSKVESDLAHNISTWINDDCCYNYFTAYLAPHNNSALTIGKRIFYQGTADSEIY